MSRDVIHSASSYAPFELCVEIKSLSGCEFLNRNVSLQIEVDGRGVGETPHVKARDGTAAFAHMLTLPLASMTARPIKFVIKTKAARKQESVLGIVQNDALMNKMMWMKPDK